MINKFLSLYKKPFIIAEAGVNHNGDLENALRLVDIAKNSGADAIKFQNFKSKKVVSESLSKAVYQRENTQNKDNMITMLKNLELSNLHFEKIKKYCDKKKIIFFSTPANIEDLKFLQKLNVKLFKMASYQIIEFDLLNKYISLNKPLIISNGMATEAETENLISYIISKNFLKYISLMHCVTNYPAKAEDYNLNYLSTIKNYGCKVGLSDHTENDDLALIAVSLGADIVEKHFTIDKSMEGPDHKCSYEPHELKKYIGKLKNVQKILGKNKKIINFNEKNNIFYMRRSYHAAKDIRKGDIITRDKIQLLRPYSGVKPFDLKKILKKRIKKNVKRNQKLLLSYF